jgi:hypothetical protein
MTNQSILVICDTICVPATATARHGFNMACRGLWDVEF